MKLAQSSAVYFNYTLHHAINDLARLGYDGIEIWGGRPHMYRNDLDDQVDDIVFLLKKNRIQVCNFIPAQFRYPSILCSENDTVRKSSVDYIKSAMDNAVKVDSPSVSLCPGMVLFDQDRENGRKQLYKSLKEVEEYNQDKKLFLLIEPAHRFETNLILTVDDCLHMIDQLKSDRFGVLIDTGHLHVNEEDFSEAVMKCKGLPFHIHLDDNNGDSDSHLMPGSGSMDFDFFSKKLIEIDYQGFFSVELGTSYIMDPTKACKETKSILDRMFTGADKT